ncbi:type IV pilus modification protein PilV [Endozoicomonas gorgoniicola]|uniref:Type IV pilus modification protein PilV n=1 Tax=Endozoicomonas gorgoniicola TaxID=1234144 RepID=A0ABT3MXX4_9GAMM|nr:type IV pilus modification protein PilV [Endozoicomonas gorgoniicola]MCW7553829.1 type IV pilus modification protein PilV [Endozoicomonas gorgoniicola]
MINRSSTSLKNRSQNGITLIEVLIANIILAAGLLGAAALQNQTLQFNNQARLNTLANMLAYDMMSRIIANNEFSTTGTGYSAPAASIPATYPDACETSSCNPTQLADYDINQWKFLVRQYLPDGDGTIAFTTTTGNREYTITISFNDSRGRDTDRQVILRGTL